MLNELKNNTETKRVKSPRDPPENSQISAQDFLPVCSF
jgi:hypothetical protein